MSEFTSEDSPTKKKRRTKFKEVSSTLSKEEVIRRLKSAAQELTNIDQGENTSDFDEFSAALITPFILNHKDKDVKSYAACCLADILRIYAPEPPYNETQLKSLALHSLKFVQWKSYFEVKAVLRILIHQLKGLENVKGPSYKRHFYILESLALVKTFNVCLDLDAQDIIIDTFKLFFTIVSDQHNIRVKNFMLDIMSPLIQESDSLPQEILNVILVHLIDPRKSRGEETLKQSSAFDFGSTVFFANFVTKKGIRTLNESKFPESYKLACDLLDRCSSAIEPYIQLFFNNSFILGGEVQGELVNHLYDLLFELFRVNKGVLLSVLPQLEFKLKGNEESDRLEAVRLLGRMFEDDDTSLADTHKALWNAYLGRFLDISVDVRMECVHLAKRFLVSAIPKLQHDITEKIVERFHDPDEKVRFETVLAVCEAAAENFEAVPHEVLDGVKERMRDKKWLVRREAITCVGKLYKKITGSKSLAPSTKEKLSWVPEKVINLYAQNSIEDRLCIERVLHGCLIPVTFDIEDRMKRLLDVYLSFGEYSCHLFDMMMKHRAKVTQDFCNLIESYLEENEEKDGKEKRVYSKALVVAKNLPEPFKAQDHLKKFMMLCKEKSFSNLLRIAIDNNQECPKIIKAVTDVMKRISQKNPINDTVKALLDRACPMLIDKPSFIALLKFLKQLIDGISVTDKHEDCSEEELLQKAKTTLKLVKTLANTRPSIFQTKQVYEQLLLFIKQKDSEIVETTLEVLYLVISQLEKVDKTLSACYQPVLSKLITNGTCRQSKYAVRCLHEISKDSHQIMERVFKNLMESMSIRTPFSALRTTLTGLSEIAYLCPMIFDTKHKEVVRDFVVKKVLVVDRETTSSDSLNDSENEEWGDESSISEETWLKMKAMTLLTKWLLGLKSNHADSATPVFRLLYTILCHDGDLTGNGKVSSENRSRLRLAAAAALLKLVQSTDYVDMITMEQYRQLALVIQDSCYEVRDKFTTKLQKALSSLKLPLDYFAFLALVATDTSRERKNKVRLLIAHNAQTRRDYLKQHSAAAARPFAILPEYTLPYVVYLLAHHPDFDHENSESLRQTKEYLWFFLEPIMGAKAENYSFLKKMLENIKQTKDKEQQDDESINEKIYSVCDLAVTCIMKKSHTFTLKDFPGNVVLPKKLFILDRVSKSNTKSYLPRNFVLSPKKSKSVPDVKGKTRKQSEVAAIPKSRKTPEASLKRQLRSSNEGSSKVSSHKPVSLKTRNAGRRNFQVDSPTSNSSNNEGSASCSPSPAKRIVLSNDENSQIPSPRRKSGRSNVENALNSPTKKLRPRENKNSPRKTYPSREASPVKRYSIQETEKALTEKNIPQTLNNSKTTRQTRLDEMFKKETKFSNKKSVNGVPKVSQSSQIRRVKPSEEKPPLLDALEFNGKNDSSGELTDELTSSISSSSQKRTRRSPNEKPHNKFQRRRKAKVRR